MRTTLAPKVKTYCAALRVAALKAFSEGDKENTDGAMYAACMVYKALGRNSRGYPSVERVEVKRYFADCAEAEAAVETLRANKPKRIQGVDVVTTVLDRPRG